MATTGYHSSIDIPEDTRGKINALLNRQLADTFDLFSQTKQAHWNVKGMNFYQLHELFDTLAEELEGYTDTIAERITALGGTAEGTARMTAKASRLAEIPLELGDGRNTVKLLAERYAALAASTRQAIDVADKLGDVGTSDLFTAISRDVDKALWFLEAHLQA
jgi:starvation-inducible DNA-binding protein